MDPAHVIDQALKEIDRLLGVINGVHSTQIRSKEECELVKANAFAWFKSHRPQLKILESDSLLITLDDGFRGLLAFADRSTTKARYQSTLKSIRKDLIDLRSKSAHIAHFKGESEFGHSGRPDFKKLISDDRMVQILVRRWDETVICLQGGAPLSATVMMGALLESLFLARVNQLQDKKPLFKLRAAPIDGKTKKALPLQDWTLNTFIDVALEMGWIRKPAKDVSVVIRDYRNFIHPVKELASGFQIEASDTKMLWAVFSQLASQILDSI